MFHKETRLYITDLLASYAEEEKDLECLRQSLCEMPSFEPYIAFRCIDTSNNGLLSAEFISEFLSCWNFFYNSEKISYYIYHYDQDFDNKLNYSEFLQSVLPMDNSELRFSISQRPIKKKEEVDEFILKEIEKKLAFLINREIQFYIKFEQNKQNFVKTINFDLSSVFQNLALRNKEELGFEDLKVFFMKNSYEIKDDEIILMMRRIDLNGDGKIDFHEFENAFLPKNKYPIENKNKGHDKINKKQNEQNNYLQVLRDKKKFLAKPNISYKTIKSFKNKAIDEKIHNILELFEYYLKIEKNYEDLKQELAMQEDFTIIDLFRAFDQDSKGFCLPSEIEFTFNDIGLNPTKTEIFLFIRVINPKLEGKIMFETFFHPKQLEYANILNKRQPKPENLPFRKLFCKKTIKMIKQLIESYFENETFLEMVKEDFFNSPMFNLEKIFDLIDYDNDGFISLYDLRRLFEKTNEILTEKQLLTLFDRFDKDEDSFISFYEFDAELQQKLKENPQI